MQPQTRSGTVACQARIRASRNPATASVASTSGTRATGTPSGNAFSRRDGKAPVEHDEDAAIVGAADQPAIGLPQPQPGDPVAILRRRRRPACGRGAVCPGAAREPGRRRAVAASARECRRRRARRRCRGGRILLGAENVDEGRRRHRVDVLGEQREAARLESRGDALVHGAQPGDRGEQAERAAAGRDKQRRISRRDLPDVVARNVGDDEYPGLRGIVERARRCARRPGSPADGADR